ncbi:hypothetical protein FNV43_RR26915 [Rhamnella rubrinervis]|uniref:Uncharacterized protein n=1 Tax=Rhamnella rubrinervis TaxID=2594499 RepID=A0A8K0GP72_9ROSA|nr:hypothetical protein FNV43_RR26915 [Rhamnella rubrinervis]
MMLLTFLEANNILRHRDRLPNNDLKLSLRVLWLWDRLPSESPANAVFGFDPEHEESSSTDLIRICLALGAPEDEEEVRKDVTITRCRLRGVVLEQKNIERLQKEEEEEQRDEDVKETEAGFLITGNTGEFRENGD